MNSIGSGTANNNIPRIYLDLVIAGNSMLIVGCYSKSSFALKTQFTFAEYCSFLVFAIRRSVFCGIN